jgi:PAS domain S-box-containing protein
MTELRVLLIEDNEDDAILVLAHLEEGGFRTESVRVETPSGLLEALGATRWDVVISDYNLPQFDGLAALAIVRKYAPDLPFIIVSGAVGEEFVADAMRAGAQDFVSKNRLVRLAPSVRRELAEAEVRRARKRAEAALEASEENLRTRADNIPQHAWMADERGRLVWVNKRWCDYTGFTLETDGSECWKRLLHPDYAGRITAFITHYIRTGTPWDETVQLKGHDGVYRWFLSRALPIRDADGRITRWFGTETDITEIRETERELAQAKEQAEAANRSKSEFLARMSHEIRTPIGGIIGLTGVLLPRLKDPTNREYLTLIRRSAESLLSIIGDVLDLSKIESGKIEMTSTVCSIKEVIENLASTFEPQARVKGLSWQHSIQAEIPDRVNADADKIAQVLRNLLSNAVKYTKRGGISFTVSGRRTGDRSFELLASVSDTGIGISRDKLPLLFESFTRLHSSLTHSDIEGTGLGLSIAKQLVNLMDGRISVESVEHQGSTFTVEIPLEIVEEKPPRTPEPDLGIGSLPPLSILVAEDNEINQLFLKVSLESAGHRVEVARNGSEVLSILERTNGTQPPHDVILMDIQMPLLDGIEATERIRGLSSPIRDIPIIALTAFAMKEDENRFRQAGMDGYVTKPVNWDELARVITDVLVKKS